MENHQLSHDEIIDEIKKIHRNRKLFEKIAAIISNEYHKYDVRPLSPADILQEASLRILSGRRKVSREYEFSEILIYVSKSVMRDWSRKNYNQQTEMVEFEDREEEYELVEETNQLQEVRSFTEYIAVEPNQQKQLEKEEMAQYIYRASNSDRIAIKVFELRKAGFTNKEIAMRCNINVIDVEKALNRLRTRGKKFRRHT